MKRLLGTLFLLLLPALVGAQATISSYEFSDVAMDYTAAAPNSTTYSLQGTAGQDVITVSPPTNTGQTLAYAGFGETYVPFAYLAQVSLQSFIGSSNPGVLYGVGTNIPFTAELWNLSDVLADVPVQAFYANASGTVKVLSPLNPAFAQSLSLKGPLWLRQKVALTAPSDPVNGYPSATFALAGGDTNNDNLVDISDFGILVSGYSSTVTDSSSGYDPHADLNQDGIVDIADFSVLVANYSSVGDL